MNTQAIAQKPTETQTLAGTRKLKANTAAPAISAGKAKRASRSGAQSTLDSWISMSRSELDEVYKKAKPGAIPQGSTRGTAILGKGMMPRLFSKAARSIAWQGKVFDLFAPDFSSGVVVNKILPVGLHSIVAKTYRGESWMDGKDTIIIDYSDTSILARQIRDEIREVEPGLYLGKVWWGKTRILDFALETSDQSDAAQAMKNSATRKAATKKR